MDIKTLNACEKSVILMYRTDHKYIHSVLVYLQMTALARSQMTGAMGAPTTATDSSLLDKHDKHEGSHAKHQQAKSHSERY